MPRQSFRNSLGWWLDNSAARLPSNGLASRATLARKRTVLCEGTQRPIHEGLAGYSLWQTFTSGVSATDAACVRQSMT
jgi:hypothetical protein